MIRKQMPPWNAFANVSPASIEKCILVFRKGENVAQCSRLCNNIRC